MRFHHLLPAMILTFALAATAGCKKKSDSGSSDGTTSDGTKSGTDGTKSGGPKGLTGAPDFTMTPAEFRAEFAKDGKAADQKFRNQTIQLNGVVTIVGKDPFGEKAGIYLKAEGEWSVFCTTADPQPWTKVAPGATVKVKGTLPSAISYQNPTLDGVQIIDAGGSKSQSLTAAQLTKEFLADPNGTKAKYDKKAVSLEGEIIETKPVGSDMIVRLKGEQGTVVIVSISKKGLENAKAGQKIKVFGDLNIPPAGAKDLFLYASALAELK
jgi:hypothetical protein